MSLCTFPLSTSNLVRASMAKVRASKLIVSETCTFAYRQDQIGLVQLLLNGLLLGPPEAERNCRPSSPDCPPHFEKPLPDPWQLTTVYPTRRLLNARGGSSPGIEVQCIYCSLYSPSRCPAKSAFALQVTPSTFHTLAEDVAKHGARYATPIVQLNASNLTLIGHVAIAAGATAAAAFFTARVCVMLSLKVCC